MRTPHPGLLAACVSLGIGALGGCQLPLPVTVDAAEARFVAALAGSVGALEPLLASDFAYSTLAGTYIDKSALLDQLRSGAIKVDQIAKEELRRVQRGNVVVTMGNLVVDARLKGEPMRLRSRYLHVWIRTSGGWQLIAREAVRIPDGQPPQPD